jgi:tetratricopeptide (TPR) repeat protein
VIEGSVARMGDKVKISASLSKAADGFQVWTDSFLRDAKDVFAVEEEIAGLIAKQLSLKLGVSSAAATASVNPEAFELYVRGRRALDRRTADGYEQADALFARAIELDLNFARAYVGRADVLDLRAWDDGSIGGWDQRNSEVFKKIHALLDRAIALDPELAEAHASLGTVIYDEWKYSDAMTASRRAVQLNPNYATGWFWLGEMLWDRGEMDEALAAMRQAVDLDRLSLPFLSGYSFCLRDAGRPTEALAFAERAAQLQPDSRRALGAKALALLDLGRKEAAVPLARALLGTDDGRGWWATGMIVARAGLKTETEALLASYRQSANDRQVAPILALLERREDFFAAWQKRPIMTNQPWYIWSPQLDVMRKEPRFRQVLEQVGLTEAHDRAQAWRKAHPPEKPEIKK